MADAASGATEAQAFKKSRPFSAFERMVAWRYLRSRRKEAFISVIAGFSFIGIMLGVATLIIVMAVMNGFRTELISRILGINGHMIIQPIDSPLNDYGKLAERLAAVPGVTMAIPLVEGQTLAQGTAGGGTGALVRGIRADDLAKLKSVSDHIKEGDLVGFASGGGVAIGARMAEQLGLSAGGQITLVAPEGDVTPLGVNPRVKTYTVSAIFEIGMSEYDASIIYMPLDEAQRRMHAAGFTDARTHVDERDDAECKPRVVCRTYPEALERAGQDSDRYLTVGLDPAERATPPAPDTDAASPSSEPPPVPPPATTKPADGYF